MQIFSLRNNDGCVAQWITRLPTQEIAGSIPAVVTFFEFSTLPHVLSINFVTIEINKGFYKFLGLNLALFGPYCYYY